MVLLQGKCKVHIKLPQPRSDGYGVAIKPAAAQQQQMGQHQQHQHQQLGGGGSAQQQQQQPSSKQAGKRRQPAPADVVSLLTDSDSDLEDPLKHRQQQQPGKRSRP